MELIAHDRNDPKSAAERQPWQRVGSRSKPAALAARAAPMRQMSIEHATRVDVEASRIPPTVDRDPPDPLNKDADPMQSIAAYYVFVATEHAREQRRPGHQVVPAQPSFAARVLGGLTSLVRPARRNEAQPA
jgi:hypothetical protein